MNTRFGIIGTGRITRRLVADLQSTPGVSVTAIASRDTHRARWFADQYGIANAVVGYEALLKRDDVDAVYISLPPSLHREWSIAAANHGKHILCEKPLTLNVAQSHEIAQACEANHVRWLDATGWLHHERTACIQRLLDEGRLGTIGHISASVSFYRPFQSDDHRLDRSLGGGALLDLGWYVVGLARFVTKSRPIAIQPHVIEENGVPIRVNAMMLFERQVTATVSCGYDTATRKWFEIAGSDASIVCDDFTRPWADKPARFWIHEASGKVEQMSFEHRQEQAMIGKLIGSDPLDDLHQQALDTQAILESMETSSVALVPREVTCE